MNSKYFITTTLPYVNGAAHVGHLFEFVLGDILARWFRISGKDVKFNVGLDENGNKILKAAKDSNISVSDFLDNKTIVWKDFCETFRISYDNFYKTSSTEHYENAKEKWIYYLNNDDIFKKEYTGKYCIGCESFKLDKDLVNGRCPDHLNLDLETITEDNYFFKLDKYRDSILNWLKSNPIIPTYKQNELLKYIDEYNELCISRKKTELTLGVDVPNDDTQVQYVWKDALESYLVAAKEYWDEGTSIQLCGSDNLRFQAQIYQSFLASLGKKHTDKILIHGTILDSNGNKLSKTVGNVVDPLDQYNKFGLDAVRYYCASNFENFNWDENLLKNNFNSHIVNGYGNLVARVLHLIDINNVDITVYKLNHPFIKSIRDLRDVAILNYNNLNIKAALETTKQIIDVCNQYINDNRPWELKYGYEEVLNNLYVAIEAANELYTPIFPDKCELILDSIKNKKKIVAFERIK